MATENTAVVVAKQSPIEPFRQALEERADRIAELAPDPRRFMTVSLLALSKNPALLECDRASVVLGILEAAEVGLEPTGAIGGAHLVPFKDKAGKKHAQLIYDYRGVQHLIREGGGGEVKTVLVYEGDDFDVFEGTSPRIEHRPKYLTTDPTKITHVYAVPSDHPEKFEVMTKEQIDGIRARSRAKNDGPWVTDYGAMARKTVLKRISAWLPLRPETREALERDTQREIAGPEAPVEAESRTSAVRDRIRSRRKGASAPETAQDAPEAAGVADESAPTASAGQQTPDAATADEGEVREVCGERFVPREGPIEECVLAPHGAETAHETATGKRWNA